MEFNPFHKPFHEVTGPDLDVLRTVREGWFVDYKLAVDAEPQKTAKFVSSFANQHGGWLFYGVEENSRAESVAGSFPGIPMKDLDASMSRIGAAVRQHLDPWPEYEIKTIVGPIDELQLPADAAIIVVRIPEGNNAPYIHSTGVIYQRCGDASVPVDVTIQDRNLLDRLVGRSELAKEGLRRRLAWRPQLSDIEIREKIPYLITHITSNVWEDKTTYGFGADVFRQALAEGLAPLRFVPTVLQTTGRGFRIAVRKRNSPRFGLSLLYDFRGHTTLVFPVHRGDVSGIGEYMHAGACRGFIEPGLETKTLDLGPAWALLAAALTFHEKCSREGGCSGDTWLSSTLINTWRTIPYMDSEGYLNQCQANGPPEIDTNEVTTTSLDEPTGMSRALDDRKTNGEMGARSLQRATPAFHDLLRACGIDRPFASSEEAIDLVGRTNNRFDDILYG